MTELNNTVLIVTPHPDDAEGGAGGTIARWSKEGMKIVLVVCTNGDKGSSDRQMTPVLLAKTREKEQRDAARVLGISTVVFLGFPDQGLEDDEVFREKLVRQIRIHKPDVVVTNDPNRPYILHRDHKITGRVTLDAVFPYARDHMAFPHHLEEGLEPHKVKEVYLFRSDNPDTYIDITATFETKMDALYCHASQMTGLRKNGDEGARRQAAKLGGKIGVALAESFLKIQVGR